MVAVGRVAAAAAVFVAEVAYEQVAETAGRRVFEIAAGHGSGAVVGAAVDIAGVVAAAPGVEDVAAVAACTAVSAVGAAAIDILDSGESMVSFVAVKEPGFAAESAAVAAAAAKRRAADTSVDDAAAEIAAGTSYPDPQAIAAAAVATH